MDEMTDLYFDLMHKVDDDLMSLDIERERNAKNHIEREEIILSKLISILKRQIESKETLENLMKDLVKKVHGEDKKQSKNLKILSKNIKELKTELNEREEELKNKSKTIKEIKENIRELEEEREEHLKELKNMEMKRGNL